MSEPAQSTTTPAKAAHGDALIKVHDLTIGWDSTVEVLDGLADAVRSRRNAA